MTRESESNNRPHPGRVAVITGASAGIGKAISLRLGRAGYRLALAARSSQALEQVRQQVSAAGGEAHAFPADVSRLDSLQHMVEQIEDKLGRIDVLINNAGIDCFAEFDRISPEHIQQTIQT
ncbi:MAG: SDR family NAD(P)-dependent oxidoreductase, partial [Planctomycetaceae bacterium]|nr:SDR family NAD(P)-dependent oxidoreductase [Planctomycetaceae bacterium]